MYNLFDLKNVQINAVLYVEGEKEYVKNGRTVYGSRRAVNEMVYKFGGKAIVTSGSNVYEVCGGTIDVLAKGECERYYVDTEEIGDCVDIFFESDTILPKENIIIDATANPRLRELFLRMYKIWTQKANGYSLKCTSLFYEILYEICQLETKYQSSERVAQIEKGVEYLREHYCDRDFDCGVLGDICGMSYTYFRRIFSIQYKMSPVKYITMLRMERAAELLKTEKYSCSQIADMLGYQNAYYFSKVFKGYFGVPPTKYG